MMFLLGRQATFGHAPPTYFRSIEAVRLPSLAIVQAINLPAVPLPSTRTSYLSGWLIPSIPFVHQHVWDKKLFVRNQTRGDRGGACSRRRYPANPVHREFGHTFCRRDRRVPCGLAARPL